MKTERIAEPEITDGMQDDWQRLTESARSLFNATADVADERIKVAREKLKESLHLDEGRSRWRERALASARVADQTVRGHPYETIGAALGLGVLIGCLIMRRD